MKREKLPAGKPPRIDKDHNSVPSSERGTLPGEKRKTYIVNTELADKIDAIAFWDRLTVKEVVNNAFTDTVEKYEKKNGPIKTPGK
jgi:hypothetical protein